MENFNSEKVMNINEFVKELSSIIDTTCLNNTLYTFYLATINFDENKIVQADLDKFKSDKANSKTVLAEKDKYKTYLIQKLLYRMGYYFNEKSTFRIINFFTIRNSNLELMLNIDGFPVTTSVIYAGGEIQTLHCRFLVKTSIKSSKESISYRIDKEANEIKRNNRQSKNAESDLKKVNRLIDKQEKEVEFYSNKEMLEGFKICLAELLNGNSIVDLLEHYKVYGVKYGYSTFDYIKNKKQLINTYMWDYAALDQNFEAYKKLMQEKFPHTSINDIETNWKYKIREYVNYFVSMIEEFKKLDKKKEELEKLYQDKEKLENLKEITEAPLFNKLVKGEL